MTDSDDGLSQTLSVQQQSEDDLMAHAPEEFLDAIMGTLMRDPVTLLSSGQTVDRVPKFDVCNYFFVGVAVYIQNVGMFYVEYPLFAYTLTLTKL